MFVLIGLIDQPISRAENIGWDTNKVGGKPSWLITPEESLATCPPCRLCGRPLSLVTQLYCPLGSSAFHRCLYVFACPEKCNSNTQGWQVYRSMQYDAAYDVSCTGKRGHTHSQQRQDMDVNSWGEEADDWGDGADDWGEGADDWGDDADDWDEADAGKTVAGEGLACQNDSIIAAVAVDRMTNVSNSFDSTPAVSNDVQHLMQNFSSQMNIVSNSDDQAVSQELHGKGVGSSSASNAGSDEMAEEAVLLADSSRLDAMAGILNTRHQHQEEDEGHASSLEHVVFKPYYLEVVEEPVEEEHVSDHVLSLIKDYEKSEGHSISSILNERPKSGKGKSGASEGYEKSELRHGDRKFHKFLKRLQRCPQQCVRYNRGGDPLLVNDLERCGLDLCPACGGERVFELQLLPALIPWLQSDGTEQKVEVDFGTVLVFTCKNNCWPDKSRAEPQQLMEEVVILQADPDRHLYR